MPVKQLREKTKCSVKTERDIKSASGSLCKREKADLMKKDKLAKEQVFSDGDLFPEGPVQIPTTTRRVKREREERRSF